MGSRKFFYGLIIVVGALVIWIVVDSLSQPGLGELKGEYTEVAFFRNENNTGPIIRIYAIHSPDSLWEEMEKYGNYMPHSKYGSTKVYFFSLREKTPKEVFPESPYFDPVYSEYCLAMYEKAAMGQVRFVKYPFK
ncbi:hypothetical protein MMU07_04145 [Aquiflexum sp. LQ15W]|uniref:hypothetical protein n=1 Tax=Cognataquiflexum nitidum TaxID=2922272 RepID=UPI001F1310CE|nr:hypothetical protein [Cognataquiflexum nitidum]MCH6198760.1 hypothetical protein [Cognataquiflexum nitidum]